MHLALVLLLSVPLPTTPAGTQLAQWLPVFAAGNQEAFRVFIAERYAKPLLDETPADYRAGLAGRTWLDAHAFDVVTIEKSSDTEIVVLARATLTGLWYRITMAVEAAPPHRITAYTTQRIQPPHATKLTTRELVREARALIDRLAAADAFSGTILLAKDGVPIYETARGWASRQYAYRVRRDTKFNLASIGKNFTAIAILQLVEQGKLALDDRVGKFLPDYPNADVRDQVTIHHLLTHTSGLGDIYGARYDCLRMSLREVRDYFPLFADDPKPLAFTPGERWQYSDIGYVLLGAILEKVTGANFYEHIRTHVFQPAGLANTDYYEADKNTPNVATPYTNFVVFGDGKYDFRLNELRNTLPSATPRGNPQGGAFSTAPDLLRYTLALPRLVSPKTLALMMSPKVEARRVDAAIESWGYGFELETVNGQRVMGHTGGDFGVSSAFRLYPDSGNYTLIVLSNTDRGGQVALYKLQELILFGR
jgi:CubicO group peptidase (beta-lactamase class C family)